MVLSNAERQARFQKRLREKAALAAQGVTVEMVDDIAAITWNRSRQEDPTLPLWDDIISTIGTKNGQRTWEFHIRSIADLPAQFDQAELQDMYGRNADLVGRVATVLRAAFLPPHRR